MKRRKALKNIGLGISAGFTLPWLSSCKEDDPGPEIKYDGVVGIIGAGAAGLFAADILSAKGVKVKVFEASDRIGGRIRSIKVFDGFPIVSDFPLELGADRIMGSDSAWGELVKLMKVPTHDFSAAGENGYFLDDLFVLHSEAVQDGDFMAAQNFRNALTAFTGGLSTTVGQLMQNEGLSTRVGLIANSWYGNAFGSSVDRIGARAMAQALSQITHDEKELVLQVNPMQDIALSRFTRAVSKVQFSKVVESVNYTDELVTINFQGGGSEIVNKLIVAVPVSVLKDGDIAFTPSLPTDKTSAMNRIGMDNSIRMILEFKRNFWGGTTSFIFGGDKCPSYFSSGLGRTDLNKTLTLTINGAKADALAGLTDEEKVLQVLAELDSVFDGDATENIRTDPDVEGNPMIYVVKDWAQEPFIKGGYSYPLPGGSNTDRTALAASIDDKLFFAGEATDDTGEFGTVNGALKSGERAAFEVIDTIV